MDYGADLAADENEGQFISTRRDTTHSADRSAPEGKSSRQDDTTPGSSPAKLRTKTPEILVTPASGSTRTSLDGETASATSRSPASVMGLSDGEQSHGTEQHQTAPTVSSNKLPNVNRSRINDKLPVKQLKDAGYSNKQLDRLLRQEQRDSGIVERGGRISLRPQEDSGMGWDSRFSSSSSAHDSGLGARSKSYDDLHEKSASASAAPLELSNTRGSETSLTDRIADIMERESPQKQVSHWETN